MFFGSIYRNKVVFVVMVVFIILVVDSVIFVEIVWSCKSNSINSTCSSGRNNGLKVVGGIVMIVAVFV